MDERLLRIEDHIPIRLAAPLQPQRPIITPDAVGCKRVLGSPVTLLVRSGRFLKQALLQIPHQRLQNEESSFARVESNRKRRCGSLADV